MEEWAGPFTSLPDHRDEHLPDVCPGCVRCKCQPCSWLKSARNGLEMAGISQEICVLYVADIAGAMPCAENLTEKNVILFIYQIISQCSWQIFATACKEQSVKIFTVSENSPFLKQNIWLDKVFFPLLLTEFLVWLSGMFSVHFLPDEQIVYSTHCLQLCVVRQGCCRPFSMSLLIPLSCTGLLAWLKGNGKYRGKQFPENTCQKEAQDSLGFWASPKDWSISLMNTGWVGPVQAWEKTAWERNLSMPKISTGRGQRMNQALLPGAQQ